MVAAPWAAGGVSRALERVVASKQVVVGETIRFAPWDSSDDGDSGKPKASLSGVMAYPILLGNRGTPATSAESRAVRKRLVGVLLATLPWDSLLHDAYMGQGHQMEELRSFVCMLENTANQTMSFLLRDGAPTAATRYGAAASAYHASTYDSDDEDGEHVNLMLAAQEVLESGATVVPLDRNYLEYRLRVYPYDSAEVSTANDAAVYATFTGMVFVFTFLLFLTYDCVVQRRQREILAAALRSTKLISSLFPARVRDRLLQQHPTIPSRGPTSDVGEKTDSEAHFDITFDNRNVRNRPQAEKATSPEQPKRRLRSLLRDSSSLGNSSSQLDRSSHDIDAKPIA